MCSAHECTCATIYLPHRRSRLPATVTQAWIESWSMVSGICLLSMKVNAGWIRGQQSDRSHERGSLTWVSKFECLPEWMVGKAATCIQWLVMVSAESTNRNASRRKLTSYWLSGPWSIFNLEIWRLLVWVTSSFSSLGYGKPCPGGIQLVEWSLERWIERQLGRWSERYPSKDCASIMICVKHRAEVWLKKTE